jgi:hypothetical protein
LQNGTLRSGKTRITPRSEVLCIDDITAPEGKLIFFAHRNITEQYIRYPFSMLVSQFDKAPREIRDNSGAISQYAE